MIVIEGPDGSGKTQLAEWIAEEYSLEYRRSPHLSSTEGPTSELIVDWWEEQLDPGVGDNGVYDRTFFISEMVYNPVMPGRKLICSSERFIASLTRLVNEVDLLIFCLPPWQVARGNLEDIGRLALRTVHENELEKIHWHYEILYEYWKEIVFEKVTRWDYTSMTNDHITEAIDELVRAAS